MNNTPNMVENVPSNIGCLGPTFLKNISPTLIIESTATKYVIDNIPALKAENPKPYCTNVFATMSVPATVFSKKLANVATEYNLLLKRLKSIKGYDDFLSK